MSKANQGTKQDTKQGRKVIADITHNDHTLRLAILDAQSIMVDGALVALTGPFDAALDGKPIKKITLSGEGDIIHGQAAWQAERARVAGKRLPAQLIIAEWGTMAGALAAFEFVDGDDSDDALHGAITLELTAPIEFTPQPAE